MEQNNQKDLESVIPQPTTPKPPKRRSRKPLYITFTILFFILFLSGSFLTLNWYIRNQELKNNQIACTADAKICPDGSAVGRIAPICEFAPCPTASPQVESTADWKTYEDDEFSFKYPNGWELNKDVQNTNQIKPELTKTIIQGDKPAIISILKINKSTYDFDKDVNSFAPFSHKELEHNGDIYVILASTYIIGPNVTTETRNEAINTMNGIYSTFKFNNSQTLSPTSSSGTYLGHKICQTDNECVNNEKCLEVGIGALKPPYKTCWEEEVIPQ